MPATTFSGGTVKVSRAGPAAFTVMLKLRVADCEGLSESVTRAMKLDVPATSGAPVMAPPEESARPAGRLPDAMLK